MRVHGHRPRLLVVTVETARLLTIAAVCGTWTYIIGTLLGLGAS